MGGERRVVEERGSCGRVEELWKGELCRGKGRGCNGEGE